MVCKSMESIKKKEYGINCRIRVKLLFDI